jgi:hypothetical protein
VQLAGVVCKNCNFSGFPDDFPYDRCPKCGRVVYTGGDPVAAPSYCQVCGAKLEGDLFCPKCGKINWTEVTGVLVVALILGAVATCGYYFIENPAWMNPVVWGCGTLALLMFQVTSLAVLFGKWSEPARSAAAALSFFVVIALCTIAGDRMISGTTFGNVVAWIFAGIVILFVAGPVIEYVARQLNPDYNRRQVENAPRLTFRSCSAVKTPGALTCEKCGRVAWLKICAEFCLLAAVSAVGSASITLSSNEALRSNMVRWGALAAIIYFLALIIRVYRSG